MQICVIQANWLILYVWAYCDKWRPAHWGLQDAWQQQRPGCTGPQIQKENNSKNFIFKPQYVFMRNWVFSVLAVMQFLKISPK